MDKSKHLLGFYGTVCSSWFKIHKRRKKQHKASDPAVGDDGIRDDLNKNPAVPQSGTDGCQTWSVAPLIVWVAKAIGWLFWSELSLHKGAPFIPWSLTFSSRTHFSQFKGNATRWVHSKIQDYEVMSDYGSFLEGHKQNAVKKKQNLHIERSKMSREWSISESVAVSLDKLCLKWKREGGIKVVVLLETST